MVVYAVSGLGQQRTLESLQASARPCALVVNAVSARRCRLAMGGWVGPSTFASSSGSRPPWRQTSVLGAGSARRSGGLEAA
jgi:hypothetical protein